MQKSNFIHSFKLRLAWLDQFYHCPLHSIQIQWQTVVIGFIHQLTQKSNTDKTSTAPLIDRNVGSSMGVMIHFNNVWIHMITSG